jgi:transposase-like protein
MTASAIASSIAKTKVEDKRHRQEPAQLVVCLVIAMSLGSKDSKRDVLKNLIDGLNEAWVKIGNNWRILCKSAITQPRQRLGTGAIGQLFHQGVAELGYDKFIVRAPKNNTSKNAELMKCPECQSTHVNKNGQKKGKQNYICVGCGRQFIDCYQPHKGYSEEVKRECLKMYVNGMGFRAIERICMSTSHQHYKLGKASRKIAS